MTDFRQPFGFEDALRAPVRPTKARLTPGILGRGAGGRGSTPRQTLARVVRRAPEVMVKITGKTQDGGHLSRHLDYISRNGRLHLEGPDGERLIGRAEVRSVAEDWTAELAAESSRRRGGAVSMSIVLSMPTGTQPYRMEDASRAFAVAVFGGRFPYVFALHDEERHPHVHLTVRMSGHDGQRLNPRKADLQAWRETFAEALRARGVQAEATPRRARGVVRKAESTAVRKIKDRFAVGGPMPDVLASAYRAAARGEGEGAAWETQVLARQRLIRRAYVAEALALARSDDPRARELGKVVEAFVRGLPKPQTQRMRLGDEIDAARQRRNSEIEKPPPGPPAKGRSR